MSQPQQVVVAVQAFGPVERKDRAALVVAAAGATLAQGMLELQIPVVGVARL